MTLAFARHERATNRPLIAIARMEGRNPVGARTTASVDRLRYDGRAWPIRSSTTSTPTSAVA